MELQVLAKIERVQILDKEVKLILTPMDTCTRDNKTYFSCVIEDTKTYIEKFQAEFPPKFPIKNAIISLILPFTNLEVRLSVEACNCLSLTQAMRTPMRFLLEFVKGKKSEFKLKGIHL